VAASPSTAVYAVAAAPRRWRGQAADAASVRSTTSTRCVPRPDAIGPDPGALGRRGQRRPCAATAPPCPARRGGSGVAMLVTGRDGGGTGRRARGEGGGGGARPRARVEHRPVADRAPSLGGRGTPRVDLAATRVGRRGLRLTDGLGGGDRPSFWVRFFMVGR